MRKDRISKSLILIILSTLVLIGCNINVLPQENIMEDSQKIEYGFKRAQYNFLLPSLLDNQVVEIADNIF